jgi:hypothetical protein
MLSAPRGASLGVLRRDGEARFADASRVVFEGPTITSSELGATARRFAGGLIGLGVSPW